MTPARLAAFLATVAIVLAAAAAEAQDASATVMTVCTRCHTPKRICDKLGVKDMAFWEKTIARMISHGAKLAPADKPLVAGWLAALQSGAKPPCL